MKAALLISTYMAEVAALNAGGREVVERIANTNIRDYLKQHDESILS